MFRFSPILLLAALLCITHSPAQASGGDDRSPSFTTSYMLGSPLGSMNYTINRVHSFHLAYEIPLGKSPLTFGFEMGVGSYGREKTDQYYRFDNGDQMLAPVSVTNNMVQAGLALNYIPMPSSWVSPVLTARLGGARLGTHLSIEDPRESHTVDCPVPLVSETLQRDLSFTYGLGAGLRFDLGRAFPSLDNNRFFLILSANYLAGTPVSYMSVNPPQHAFNTGEGVESVNIRFASEAQPEIHHEYHSGYLYRTRLEMVQFGFGITMTF